MQVETIAMPLVIGTDDGTLTGRICGNAFGAIAGLTPDVIYLAGAEQSVCSKEWRISPEMKKTLIVWLIDLHVRKDYSD